MCAGHEQFLRRVPPPPHLKLKQWEPPGVDGRLGRREDMSRKNQYEKHAVAGIALVAAGCAGVSGDGMGNGSEMNRSPRPSCVEQRGYVDPVGNCRYN